MGDCPLYYICLGLVLQYQLHNRVENLVDVSTRCSGLCLWSDLHPEEDQSIWSKRRQGFQPCCEAGIGGFRTNIHDASNVRSPLRILSLFEIEEKAASMLKVGTVIQLRPLRHRRGGLFCSQKSRSRCPCESGEYGTHPE